jgi:hypothetical protein
MLKMHMKINAHFALMPIRIMVSCESCDRSGSQWRCWVDGVAIRGGRSGGSCRGRQWS